MEVSAEKKPVGSKNRNDQRFSVDFQTRTEKLKLRSENEKLKNQM